MSASIIACPQCRTMLLSDTVECPACKHILDESRYAQWRDEAQDVSSNVVEDQCRHCGESVRRGLVRCWNCGEFMREDIAAAYKQMQSSPRPVVYSPLPGNSQPTPAGSGSPNQPLQIRTSADSEISTATDKDFELGERYRVQQSTDAAQSSSAAPAQPPPPPSRSETEDQPPPSSADASHGERDTASGDSPEKSEMSHSEATGGDVLLNIARAEEAEVRRRKRQRKKRRLTQARSPGAILLYCPNGHRIEVADKYRGMTGRCPKCRSPFIVPPKSEEKDEAEPTAEGEEQTADAGIGKYVHWMQDVPVHAVNPERLRLKPGSLKNDFQLYDLGFAEDEILIVTLAKRKGAAGATSKKRLDDREKLFDFLRNDGPLADLPAAGHFTLNAEQAKSVSVAQPPLYPHESLFADVPVFGEGRIAVRLLIEDDPKIRHFASFTLSKFREFARIVNELYGVKGLGEDVDVPLTDSFTEAQCHYSEQPLKFLEHVEYYQADPEIELTLVGRKCQACGLVISEDSRKKEKIGGVNGKTIAKAKCPKCQQKFGTLSLYALVEQDSPSADASDGKGKDEAAAVKTETAASE